MKNANNALVSKHPGTYLELPVHPDIVLIAKRDHITAAKRSSFEEVLLVTEPRRVAEDPNRKRRTFGERVQDVQSTVSRSIVRHDQLKREQLLPCQTLQLFA